MQREAGETQPSPRPCPNACQSGPAGHHRQPIERRHAAAHMRPELDGGRADADHGIIGDVLERVDRVVTHGPQDGTGIESDRRPTEAAGRGGPADESAPGKG